MLLEYCKDPLVRQGMSERGKAYNKAHPEFGLALSKAGADAKRGTTTSDATKAKMAEARREHWANLTPEQRTDREYKCGNAMRGKHLTDEHRNRVSVGLSATLAELTPEQRSERMRAAREARTFGPHSEAHNKKISDSLAATLAKLSPNQLSERSRKAWVTRRQNTQEVSRHAS